MGSPYSSQTIADYNTSPPADDASEVASNQLFWSKHKEKLADPIKTLSEAINTELVAAFAKLHLNQKRAITANDTQVAADERKLISATNTITYTLLPAATAGDGFTVAVLNAGTGVITIEADGSELINQSLNRTLSDQYDLIFLRCDGTGWNVVSQFPGGAITLGTETASTSGTEIDFTGIPAGVTRVTVMIDDVSTNGTDSIIVQIGDSGGIETSGYVGQSEGGGSSVSGTAGFLVNADSVAAATYISQMVITRMNDSHKWVAAATTARKTSGNQVHHSCGNKTLSAELTQLRVTTVGGTDTFDAGNINIAYE